MKIKLLLNSNVFLTCFLIIGIFNFSPNSLNAQSTVYTEDFDGFTTDTRVGADADWYDNNAGPFIRVSNGVMDSKGLEDASAIFSWTAHTFNWNAADFESVSFQMDFETNGNAQFDDDRIGWMFDNPTTSSSNIMGVQLDPGGSGYNIEGYWDGASADRRPSIVNLTSLTANTWYRFWAKFTKLTPTSCSIDVSLTELDGNGDPTGTPVTGSIANTATLGADAPNSKYFTAGLSPAYKNHDGTTGDADNAYYELITTVASPTITVTSNLDNYPFSTIVNTPSAEQSYSVSGFDLTDDITITPPSDFELSTTSGSGFSSSVVLTESGGTVPSTTVYVRFNSSTIATTTGDILHSSSGATTENVSVKGTAYQGQENWVAYNDCVYDATKLGIIMDPNGQFVHYLGTNTTTYGIGSTFTGSTSGTLVNHFTGGSLAASVAFTESNTVIWQPDASTNWYGGYDCAAGTDARSTFGGKADMTGVIYYGSSGWWVDVTFSNLNENLWYTFATSASRCNPSYSERNTRYTISGIDGAKNVSSTGVYEISNESVWFNTGGNYDEGYVARWTDIKPGADGSFTVRSEANDPGTEYKAYSFDVFMLQEINDPLPVELSSFTGSVLKDMVELNWKTETEVNNYGFEVERKTEESDWQKMGFVEGHGNSNSPKNYTYLDDSFSAGKYTYRLKQIDNDGKFEYSKTIEIELTPNEFSLFQNYPNPFNPSTTIKYALPKAGEVKLVLFNMLGEEVAVLVNELKEAGVHNIDFNAKDLGSGIYFYKFESSYFVSVKKMILVK